MGGMRELEPMFFLGVGCGASGAIPKFSERNKCFTCCGSIALVGKWLLDVDLSGSLVSEQSHAPDHNPFCCH